MSALPQSVDAERALLGAILFDDTHLAACSRLTPDQFYDPAHRRMFAAMRTMSVQGQRVDQNTLAVRLAEDPTLVEAGGARRVVLETIAAAARTRVAVGEYAGIVIDLALRREMIRVAREVEALALAPPEGESGPQIIARAEKAMQALSVHDHGRVGFRPLIEIMQSAVERARAGKANGLSTGIESLDALTGGFVAGHFWAVGGRAKQGKTTLSQHFGVAVARQDMAVLRFDLEMTDDDIGLRHATAFAYEKGRPVFAGNRDHNESNPTYISARRNTLTEKQWERVEAGIEAGGQLPIVAMTAPGLGVARIEAEARRQIHAFQKRGIQTGLIIIDHTTLVKAEIDRRGHKAAEVGDVIDDITAMGKRLGVCVIGLCQINRDAEDERRPQKHHLAWSSKIEQNANVVALAWRPASKLENLPSRTFDQQQSLQRIENHLHLFVDGNRNGPNGRVACITDLGAAMVFDAPHLKDEVYQ